jgi:aldehyde dehydrogenase
MQTALHLKDMKALAARLGEVKTYGHFIGGTFTEGHSGETITLSNPATRQTLAHIQSGDATDVRRAVDAAHAAFAQWSKSSPGERQQALLAIAERLRRRVVEFAMMETLNNGKTITEAHTDVGAAISYCEFYAGTPYHLNGETIDFADATVLVHREPIGVVAQIIPWNVALAMTLMKLAPALAAGCTVVLKPAETVCMSVLEFAKEIADILPPGVFNIVTGYGAAIGEALVTDPRVRKVTFTGSTATARKVMQYASVNIIPQTMELGGKSANIVCDDADLDAAAQSAVLSTIFNKGEVCLAGTRVFVHKKVREEFIAKFVSFLSQVKQGDPVDPSTQLGAQASQQQFDRVKGYIELGKQEGAVTALGGGPSQIKGFENGLFILPTIFTGVRNEMRIAREEIFGPVTGVIEWDDEADLLRSVNDSIYGLGGGLWTRNLARAHRISRGMETGTVWINRYYNFKPGQPIGGYKQSGFGRENALATLNDYTITKSVVINLDEGEPVALDRPLYKA